MKFYTIHEKDGEKMANPQNLIPQAHVLTVEEASKGGVNSGKTRRLKGAIERALDSAASSPEFEEIFERFKVNAEDRKYADAIGCVLVAKAAQGNLEAIAMVRDTIGEKPSEDINLNGGVVIVDDLTDSVK